MRCASFCVYGCVAVARSTPSCSQVTSLTLGLPCSSKFWQTNHVLKLCTIRFYTFFESNAPVHYVHTLLSSLRCKYNSISNSSQYSLPLSSVALSRTAFEGWNNQWANSGACCKPNTKIRKVQSAFFGRTSYHKTWLCVCMYGTFVPHTLLVYDGLGWKQSNFAMKCSKPLWL